MDGQGAVGGHGHGACGGAGPFLLQVLGIITSNFLTDFFVDGGVLFFLQGPLASTILGPRVG